MKKILFLCFIVLGSVLPASAQIRFGVSGGITMNKVSLSGDAKAVVADNYTGWYIGPTVELGIPVVGLKFDASLQYAQNGANVTVANGSSTTNGKVSNNYISVPVNAKFNLGLGSVAAVYISAGPQFDWAVGDRDHTIGGTTFAFASSQVSANLGAGFRVLKHFQIGAYYNIPFGKTAECSVKSMELKNSTWKCNLLVLF